MSDNLSQMEYQQHNHNTHQDKDMIITTQQISDGLKSNLKNSSSTMLPSSTRTEEKKGENIEDLKIQLESLMNSLATLSAEKSKMEAVFQADRKQLRIERDQYEKNMKEIKEKWKKLQNNAQVEVENLKYTLIMERFEREKEQAQHASLIKDLQKLVSDERRIKEQLEAQIKEMTVMRKQHRIAIHEEHKRVAAAEQQARSLAMTHESRVAGLEARLAELSKTVGGYDRLRQKDQMAIQKLKEQILILQNAENKDTTDTSPVNDPNEISIKIKELCAKLMELDQQSYQEILNDLCNEIKLSHPNQNTEFKQKYENLLREFEDYKKHTSLPTNVSDEFKMSNNKSCNEVTNDKGQLHRLKTHCRNLEERIRVLSADLSYKEKEYKQKLENMKHTIQEEQIKYDRLLSQKENEYRGKIMNLEQQILRQRERSLAVINEKDQEIHTLKSSFQALLPKKLDAAEDDRGEIADSENLAIESVADLVTNFLSMNNNPPMLHYAQELARKEVQVSGLRKENLELQAVVRDKERQLLHELESNNDKIKKMQSQIERLEACKSREGANLEYLKNVFVNYLISTDNSSKRHMLNAISTVLRFTSDEMDKIRKCK